MHRLDFLMWNTESAESNFMLALLLFFKVVLINNKIDVFRWIDYKYLLYVSNIS